MSVINSESSSIVGNKSYHYDWNHNWNPPEIKNDQTFCQKSNYSQNIEPFRNEFDVYMNSYFTYGCFISFLSSEKFLNWIIWFFLLLHKNGDSLLGTGWGRPKFRHTGMGVISWAWGLWKQREKGRELSRDKKSELNHSTTLIDYTWRTTYITTYKSEYPLLYSKCYVMFRPKNFHLFELFSLLLMCYFKLSSRKSANDFKSQRHLFIKVNNRRMARTKMTKRRSSFLHTKLYSEQHPLYC